MESLINFKHISMLASALATLYEDDMGLCLPNYTSSNYQVRKPAENFMVCTNVALQKSLSHLS
uniref:Uncharacterized protein n=1 Tax=Rhizophora mucronata TaxID=61149 RepID=A0A2P2K2Z9_RHIMU